MVNDVQIIQPGRTLRLFLTDGSYLDIFSGRTGRYSYQWQRSDGTYRFNNAPHFNHIETAPHHFHHKDGSVKASPIRGVSEKDVQSVFQFVFSHIKTMDNA